MESLGDKLRSTRESKGYSFEHVGRETNIARRYLEALEGEDFAKFPGEPYLLGFLRNYGEYLGLDVDELLSLYKSIKIQEQPIPVEQLLKSPQTFPRFLIVLFIVLPMLALLSGGAYFIFIRPARDRPVEVLQEPMDYTLDGPSLERRFYKGDTILVPLGNEQFRISLKEMGDPLTLTLPGGKAALSLGGDTNVDLNGDGAADLKITLSDYDRMSPQAGALIRFDTNVLPFASGTGGTAITAAPASQTPSTVIFTSSNAYPFTLQAQFQGYCMFRWELDRRERSERYFARNDEQNMQAQNAMRLWVSNAAAVRLQVIGAGRTVPLEIGTAGEVVVVDLRWVRDDEGRFRLIQFRLE